jgi:signal transduction histidine kinase/ActR/RegA family two-component response regulator
MAQATGTPAERVLVLMPTRRDSERTALLLQEASVSSFTCADLPELCRELRLNAGALLITEDILLSDSSGRLTEALRDQPAWSALPVLVVTREGGSRAIQRLASDVFNNLIVVERPVRTGSLASVVLSALRGRRHQYQIRDVIRVREQQAAELLAQEDRLRLALSEQARQAEELRAADRRKDEFLATLAHELRNPLAPVRTGMELLLRAPDGAASQRTLAVMERQITHMVRLIDDLLDVSRITRGKLVLKRERVNLATIIATAIEASRPLIERNQHTLRVDVKDPSIGFYADVTRLGQVISNLLNNSSNYTPPGGLIELSVAREGEYAVISVRDNGSGIPREHLERVFEMFSQVNRTLDRSQGGLGIGLALVRSLVEMHGGTVSAESAGPGLGSTFSVRLPLIDGTLTAPVANADPTPDAQPEKLETRVLVVDDNEDAAELLALMLERSGYVTTAVHDGAAALTAVEAWRPHVVVLDIGLPGMSGYDVARLLRQREQTDKLTLIALTGWGSHGDKQKALEAGFDVHLTKPVAAGALQDAIARRDAHAAPGGS